MSLARITHKKKKNLFIHLIRSHFEEENRQNGKQYSNGLIHENKV